MRSLSTVHGKRGVVVYGSEYSTFLGRAASIFHLLGSPESTLVDVPFVLNLNLLRIDLVFIDRNNVCILRVKTTDHGQSFPMWPVNPDEQLCTWGLTQLMPKCHF